MVAVVTGAAGFIGQVLIQALAHRGPVIGIDRRPFTAPPGVTPLVADLLSTDPAVHEALSSASEVYHLAGCPDVRDPRPDAEQHRYRDNVLATAAVLAAVSPQTPLVVTSSSSVYGGTRAGRPSRETDALRPRGGYARSKLLVERVCQGRAQAGGRVTVVRPFTVAGEGQRPGMAFSRWLAAIRENRPLPIFGSLERTRDITDVRDVCSVLIDLVEADAQGVLNIGTGVGRSLRELASTVCAVMGVELRTTVSPAHSAEVRHTLADTRALRRAIGWVPRTDLTDVVRRQIARALAETDEAA